MYEQCLHQQLQLLLERKKVKMRIYMAIYRDTIRYVNTQDRLFHIKHTRVQSWHKEDLQLLTLRIGNL